MQEIDILVTQEWTVVDFVNTNLHPTSIPTTMTKARSSSEHTCKLSRVAVPKFSTPASESRVLSSTGDRQPQPPGNTGWPSS